MKSFLEFGRIDEVNHREHAQAGKVHPTMAKHMTVGQEHDFYHPKTGDKISGVVKHKSDKEVHLQANKDGKVGGGDTHKFTISEETAPWETDAEAKKREKSAFKKPNNPSRTGMDAARALAQRGLTAAKKKQNEQAPVAPVPDRKYIKGTPENKALKASRKPINGMPTGKMKEEVDQIDELSTNTLNAYKDKVYKNYRDGKPGNSSMNRITGVRAANKRLLKKEEVEQIEEATVKTEKHSWGKMMTVHHGASHSYPLHPEHQEAIRNLKHGEKTSFKDETGAKVNVHRDVQDVHFTSSKTATKTTVPHSHFSEEVELDEKLVGGQKELDKNKNGQLDKHDFELIRKKKTLKEFVQDLLEYETDKNGRYVHTKGSYGKSYNSETDDNDDDNKPKSTEKRGRGRPAGSKSGARQQNTGKSYGGLQTHSLNLPNTNK